MLVVGLGNPGSAYENTRHNIGFLVIDALRKHFQNSTEISKASFEGELFKVQKHYFLKPTTFMNLSGNSITAVKQFYKLDDVIVIHDDLDLPFGTLRFKFGGGHGGHNGLKSTDEKISKNYARIRMGIGKPEHKGEITSYVLGNFNEKESAHLSTWINHTLKAILELLEGKSLEDVSSQYSIKKNPLQ